MVFEETAEGPVLIGGRHKETGQIIFPLPGGATGQLYEPVRLSRTGTLWSWTVQRFRPKTPPYAGGDTPETFRPFAVGYVELPGQVIVESRLLVEDFSTLRLGLPMECVAEPFATGTTYAFRSIA